MRIYLGAGGAAGFLRDVLFQTTISEPPPFVGLGLSLPVGHPKRHGTMVARLCPPSDFSLSYAIRPSENRARINIVGRNSATAVRRKKDIVEPHDAVQSSDRSPVGNLLLQRLGGIGNGLASCGVRDGGSNARLSVFVQRPAEAAVAQEIWFNRDREGVILDHLHTMRPGRSVFQHAAWLPISN